MTESVASTISTKITQTKTSPDDTASLPWYRKLSQKKGLLLFLICMAQMLDIINIASVTIALPSIQRDVHYGDLFGHRRIFLMGTSWFAIWSLVCGFARNPIFMSVSRGLQGAGAGFTIPSALALLTTTYPLGPERTAALSLFGGAACIGQTIGVLLGGIFDATIGWYWIFYVTAIISATLAIGGLFIISKANDNPATADRRIDYVGVLMFMVGIIAVVYYLSESNSAGWGSAKTLPLFLVGIALLIAFVFWEHRIDYPIMPFRIWLSRRFSSSVAVIICVTATYNVMIFFSSLTFQGVLKYTPIITACCYIVHGVGLVIGLYTVTRLFVFMRTKYIMLIGWLLIITSSIIFAQIVPGVSYWHFAFPAFIVNCLGLSPTWMCCQVNVVADANDEDQGVVGAVFNVAMQLGGPLGLAISTIVSQSFQGLGDTPVALMDGYRAAFYTFGVFGAVGFVLTLILASNHDPIEFSGVTPEAIAGDQEKGISAVESISTSALEGDKAEATSISEISVAQTMTENNKIATRST
ncbi:hypothetical protein BGX21_010633 [Mortierella sp. AD011]|nr:hypothetical protein BGX20_007147 [Mortierella sp. AD010]KAF9393752.1 hypothetical protein BGX21_010633 [Mortierella sp. AD011]